MKVTIFNNLRTFEKRADGYYLHSQKIEYVQWLAGSSTEYNRNLDNVSKESFPFLIKLREDEGYGLGPKYCLWFEDHRGNVFNAWETQLLDRIHKFIELRKEIQPGKCIICYEHADLYLAHKDDDGKKHGHILCGICLKKIKACPMCRQEL